MFFVRYRGNIISNMWVSIVVSLYGYKIDMIEQAKVMM